MADQSIGALWVNKEKKFLKGSVEIAEMREKAAKWDCYVARLNPEAHQ